MTVTGQPVINYTFDNDNRLTQVAQGSNVLGFGYDAASRRTTITLPNGIIGTFGFDSADQLTSISYMHGATTVGTLGYGYDLGGRRTSMTGTLAGFVPPTAMPALTYDGTNRLTSWGGQSISYDANGNITNFGSATYTWNARNQLSATSGGNATFAYDALGRRVSTAVSGVTTPYLYDGQNPAMISSNQMLAGAGLDEIYAQVNSSGTTSYLRDGLNSTVALTNSSAATIGNDSYSPYGDTATTGTATTPLQYTGRENDGATGLYYNRARYYSPQLGRFISEDPIGLGGGTNFYAYVEDDPSDLRDPTGNCPWCIAVIVGAVTGAGVDILTQLAMNGGKFGCISWNDVGVAAGLGGLGAGLGGLSMIARVGTEWSHWVPARFINPLSNAYKPWLDNAAGRWFVDSGLNGNYVSPLTHALSDDLRMLSGMTLQDKLPAVLQQVVRLPAWIGGSAIGGAAGAANSAIGK